jgi:hypothetical protein
LRPANPSDIALLDFDSAARDLQNEPRRKEGAVTETPTIERLISEWVAAFNSHDLDRHMQLYAEDATLFGSVDELQVGREAIRGARLAAGPGAAADKGEIVRAECAPFADAFRAKAHVSGLELLALFQVDGQLA